MNTSNCGRSVPHVAHDWTAEGSKVVYHCPGSDEPLEVVPMHQPPALGADMVNHPPHYKQGGIETIDVIEAWKLSFCLGNTVKYISRAGVKDAATELEDLRKARWYLDREIAQLESLGG